MGWERRNRGGRYYTRSRRRNGHVVREYVGCGELATTAAELDVAERQRRLEQAEASRDMRQRLDEEDRGTQEVCETSEALVCGLLLAAGYRRHNRGEWRRKREGQEDEQN